MISKSHDHPKMISLRATLTDEQSKMRPFIPGRGSCAQRGSQSLLGALWSGHTPQSAEFGVRPRQNPRETGKGFAGVQVFEAMRS